MKSYLYGFSTIFISLIFASMAHAGIITSVCLAASPKTDNLYALLKGKERKIVQFSASGKQLAEWGSFGGKAGQFKAPTDIAVSPDERIYVSDEHSEYVLGFTGKGNPIARFRPNRKAGRMPSAGVALAIDNNGNIYIVQDNYNTKYIEKYDKSGHFLTRWGSTGNKNGQFMSPTDITVDEQGYVYVLDRAKKQIQAFSNSGRFIRAWGSDRLRDPEALAIDRKGVIYVADLDWVVKYKTNGKYIQRWNVSGKNLGHEFGPIAGIVVDRKGFVYTCKLFETEIRKFNSSGKLISHWYLK